MHRRQFRISARCCDERAVVRHRSANEVGFVLRQRRELSDRQTQALCHHFARRLRQKVGDAEGVIFREVAVIEDQDKVALSRPESLNRMTIPSRKVPDIARVERVDIRRSVWMKDRGAAGTADHVGPLGSIGMPVQLSNRARPQPHRDAGNASRNRKLNDRCAAGDATVERLRGLLLKTVAK